MIQHLIDNNMKIVFFVLTVLVSFNTLGQTISWYDSEGDKTKTIIEVRCETSVHRMVIDKRKIDSEDIITEWFDKILKQCKKEGKQ